MPPPPAAPATSARRRPWVSLTLLAALGVTAAVTLGPEPLNDPQGLAWAWGDGLSLELAVWWLAHDGGWHLAANVVAVVLFAPALERYVGSARVALAVVGGNLLGLVAHGGLNVTDRPLLGASAMVYAVVAYSLVVGWHCPFETRRGPRRRLWPALLFHGLVAVEVLRWAAQVAAQRPPGGAAAHLGGLAAGVLVCGLVHRRWPAGPTSRRARGAGAPAPTVGVDHQPGVGVDHDQRGPAPSVPRPQPGLSTAGGAATVPAVGGAATLSTAGAAATAPGAWSARAPRGGPRSA